MRAVKCPWIANRHRIGLNSFRSKKRSYSVQSHVVHSASPVVDCKSTLFVRSDLRIDGPRKRVVFREYTTTVYVDRKFLRTGLMFTGETVPLSTNRNEPGVKKDNRPYCLGSTRRSTPNKTKRISNARYSNRTPRPSDTHVTPKREPGEDDDGAVNAVPVRVDVCTKKTTWNSVVSATGRRGGKENRSFHRVCMVWS